MIETGIHIRAQINGHWNSVDIGDPDLTDEQLLAWLRANPERRTAERVVLLLLGRDQNAVDR